MSSHRIAPPVALVPLLATCLLVSCSSSGRGGRDDNAPASLSVRELNIVDEHGQTRIRIGAPLPDPKGLKRKIPAYGIQLMGPSGNEIGGLVMLDAIDVRGLCFDSEEGYEAMCVGLVQGEPSVTFRHDWKERISLGVANGVASIVLHDAQGSPQMRLEVDQDGTRRVDGVIQAPASR